MRQSVYNNDVVTILHKLVIAFIGSILIFQFGCVSLGDQQKVITNQVSNILDYRANPQNQYDRNYLAFSDQGAWFAYGFPKESINYGGFAGPFIMTQENGIWCSKVLSQMILFDNDNKKQIDWSGFTAKFESYNSHLTQVFENDQLRITQTLYFSSPHTSIMTAEVVNLSGNTISLSPSWIGDLISKNLNISNKNNLIILDSDLSKAIGIIQSYGDENIDIETTDSSYVLEMKEFTLASGEVKEFVLSHSFIFPEYHILNEQVVNDSIFGNPNKSLQKRIKEKESQLDILVSKMDTTWDDTAYRNLIVKAVLTLQNNWRIAAGELKHSGLFPSYYYRWFHGMWAWDSWKHAVALAQYDSQLAKDQIRAMYSFIDDDGFIADCIYRDTIIENHNYRNTKPPLSVWAVWKVYEQDADTLFLKEMYPMLIKQHQWWYKNRDHDKDGICEYGSTDGTLIAAKWESGMDNAARFDNSKLLRNSENAYSLDQESVDLNCYLYAEKNYLAKIAKVLNYNAIAYENEAGILKLKIQNQFFDSKTGWYYDTSIDGSTFVEEMGCEGWIPLWANIANEEQAKAIRKNMMDTTHFNTLVPLQTLSASNPKFKPNGGYWRGPTWLDQAYFGVMGLRNYGYDSEANKLAYKLMHNAQGVLDLGFSIRENYNPVTGQGLESENFSWSAAHYLLLLINE